MPFGADAVSRKFLLRKNASSYGQVTGNTSSATDYPNIPTTLRLRCGATKYSEQFLEIFQKSTEQRDHRPRHTPLDLFELIVIHPYGDVITINRCNGPH